LLAFDFEAPGDEELEKLREYGRLANGVYEAANGLQSAYWQTAAKHAYSKLGQVLDRPLGELLSAGWNRYQPFLKYCDATRYPPGHPVTERLVAHTVDATLTPRLKVLLNDAQVGEIEFKLQTAIELDGGVLTIDGGRFMSVCPGRCQASALLTCAGRTLIERKTREVQLPLEIRFGDGIPIVPTGLSMPVPSAGR
jgi:hypothetical protein